MILRGAKRVYGINTWFWCCVITWSGKLQNAIFSWRCSSMGGEWLSTNSKGILAATSLEASSINDRIPLWSEIIWIFTSIIFTFFLYWLSHIILAFQLQLQSNQSIALSIHLMVPLEVELNSQNILNLIKNGRKQLDIWLILIFSIEFDHFRLNNQHQDNHFWSFNQKMIEKVQNQWL